MPGRLSLCIIVLAILFFIYIFYNVKNKKLNIKNALVWLVLDAIIMVATLMIPTLQKIAQFFKIEVVSNMVFFFALFFLIFVSFFITKTISEMNHKIITLTQELALLKEREESRE